MTYITIDMGTTNTRIRCIKNKTILGEIKENIGVRETAFTGNTDKLKECLKIGIAKCIAISNETKENIDVILASGMITSNLGLLEIPHLEAPVSAKMLKENIKTKQFDDIINKPINFIPGVKNRTSENSEDFLSEIDMMRGEEAEVFGALQFAETNNSVIFISPGSHTKFVYVDKDNNITKCSTTLSGELLWAITKETILANSISSDLITSIDLEFIKKGINSVKTHGFSKTCFLVRIMDVFNKSTSNQLANFLMAALAYNDILSIQGDLKKDSPNILIGGKDILKDLYKAVLEITNYDMNKVNLLSSIEVEKSSAFGAIDIYNS